MSDEINKCPNCDAEVTEGLLRSNSLLKQKSVDLINEYVENPQIAYCRNCGNDLRDEAERELKKEIRDIEILLKDLIKNVPVITSHSPFGWEYTTLGMVTGQSVTGTGVVSEISSSFSDLFGSQSGRYNEKIKVGEDICRIQLQKQCLDLGGNAVIATDIDYSEMGASKGMIMVCMAGTVVKLNSPVKQLGERQGTALKQLTELNDRLRHLNSLR